MDSIGTDLLSESSDVSVDAAPAGKNKIKNQFPYRRGMLTCGRWWLLKVVSSLDL